MKRHALCEMICEYAVEEKAWFVWEDMWVFCGRAFEKRHVLVRGYVNLCERRHVLGERMKELSVEKSY